jgi:hypothetical protein
VPRSTERFITTPGGGERGLYSYTSSYHRTLFCLGSGFQRQGRVLLLLLRYYLATSDSLATTSTNRLSSRAPHARFFAFSSLSVLPDLDLDLDRQIDNPQHRLESISRPSITMFNLNFPTLLSAISLLSLIDPVTAFDYKSAIQTSNSGGPSRTGVVPNRYVLEFDNSEDARQVAKRDGSASVSVRLF